MAPKQKAKAAPAKEEVKKVVEVQPVIEESKELQDAKAQLAKLESEL